VNNKKLENLIAESANGNKESFRDIFEILSNRLFTYALSHTKNRDDALDITQDTFIEIWRSLEKFKYHSDEAFYGFAFIILKRKIFATHKKTPTIQLNNDILESIDNGYEMNVEYYRYLSKHINSLTDKYQDVLKLRYWSDMTFKEISKVLGIKEVTAKVRHHRAIQKLKINLEKYNHV